MGTLRDQVIEFHKVFEQPIEKKPVVPSDARVRLRARLMAEEFFEVLDALFLTGIPGSEQTTMKLVREEIENLVDHGTINGDLVMLADGLADLDYVVEGTRLEFGIDGGPIADEVHRANISKAVPCPDCTGIEKPPGVECTACNDTGRIALKRPDGKAQKPLGWTPPNIWGLLQRQGYDG